MSAHDSQAARAIATPERVASPNGADDVSQRAATRQAILAAADEVFSRDGFAATNLNEIASRAGVGKGTVYRHFDNKAELFVTTLIENGAVMQTGLEKAVGSDRPVLEQIEALGRAYLQAWLRSPRRYQLFWALRSQELIGTLSPSLVEQVNEVRRGPRRILAALIERGIETGEIRPCDPWATTHAIAGLVNASIGSIVDAQDDLIAPCDPHQVFEEAFALVIAGLRAEPGARD